MFGFLARPLILRSSISSSNDSRLELVRISDPSVGIGGDAKTGVASHAGYPDIMLVFDIRLRYVAGSVRLRGEANGFWRMDFRDVMEELVQWDETMEGRLLDLGGE